MKRFLIIETGSDGCDYSIGCGVRTEIVEALSVDDAWAGYIAERAKRVAEGLGDSDTADEIREAIRREAHDREPSINAASVYELGGTEGAYDPEATEAALLNALASRIEAAMTKRQREEVERLHRLAEKHGLKVVPK